MSYATIPPMQITQRAFYYLPAAGRDAVIYVNWPDGLPNPPLDQQTKLIEQFQKDRIVRSTIDEIAKVLGPELLALCLTS